jgi:hypothetical protein
LHVLESLIALNSTDLEAEAAATERGASFSVLSVLIGISDSVVRALRAPSLAFCLSKKTMNEEVKR